jgi:hypothetical protein
MTIDIDTMPAGPELDELVCKVVGIGPVPDIYRHTVVEASPGHPVGEQFTSERQRPYDRFMTTGEGEPVYPAVSTHSTAMMEVMDRLESYYQFYVTIGRAAAFPVETIAAVEQRYACVVGILHNPTTVACADTRELAVCRAALAALKAKMGKRDATPTA